MTIQPLPLHCALTTWSDKAYHWYHLLPDADALGAASTALHDWLGLLFCRITY